MDPAADVVKVERNLVRRAFDADLGVVRRPTVAVPVEGQLKLDPFLFRGRIHMPAARVRVVFFNIRRLVDRHAADKRAVPLFRRGGHDRISGQLIRSFLVRSLRHTRYVDLSAVGDGNEEKLLCLRIHKGEHFDRIGIVIFVERMDGERRSLKFILLCQPDDQHIRPGDLLHLALHLMEPALHLSGQHRMAARMIRILQASLAGKWHVHIAAANIGKAAAVIS